MSVLRKLVWIFVALPVGVVMVALAVANRHPVRFVVDPFSPQNPAFTMPDLPFYVYLLGAMFIGLNFRRVCHVVLSEPMA